MTLRPLVLALLTVLAAVAASAQPSVRDSVRMNLFMYTWTYPTVNGTACGAGVKATWPNVLQDVLGSESRTYGYSDYGRIASRGMYIPAGYGQVDPATLPAGTLGHNPQLAGWGGNDGCGPHTSAVSSFLSGAWRVLNGRPFRVTDWYATFSVPDGTPIALFEWEAGDGLAVDFDGSFESEQSREVDASAPGNKRPVASYAWDFGDGQTGSGATPSHTYDNPGEYTVRLTVTDDDGDEASREETVSVRSAVLTVEVLTATAEVAKDDTISVAARVVNTGTEAVTAVVAARDFHRATRIPDELQVEGAQIFEPDLDLVDVAEGESETETRTRLEPGESFEVTRRFVVKRAASYRVFGETEFAPQDVSVDWTGVVAVSGQATESDSVAVRQPCADADEPCATTRITVPGPAKLAVGTRVELTGESAAEGDTLAVVGVVKNVGDEPATTLVASPDFEILTVFPDSVSGRPTTDPILTPLPETAPPVTRDELAPADTFEVRRRYVVEAMATYETDEGASAEVPVRILVTMGEVTGETEDGDPVEVDRSCSVEGPDSPRTAPLAALFADDDPVGPPVPDCLEGEAELRPLPVDLIVNSIGTDDDEEPGANGCDTGNRLTIDGEEVRECTLRAAVQEAAASRGVSTVRIEFDVPDQEGVVVIPIAGTALPAVRWFVVVKGGNLTDGLPVEIDGTGLEGEVGFSLGGRGRSAVVEALAFYGFPGTVLDLPEGGDVVGSLFGTDWAGSHRTSAEAADALRNGGDAIVITGDDAEVTGNRILGSRTGIRIDGAVSVTIGSNEIGALTAPNTDYGIDATDSAGLTIGGEAGDNEISYNQTGGIRVTGELSAPLTIYGNTVTKNGGDGVDVTQSGISALQFVGGEEPFEGNTIAENDGAGVRIRGDGDATAGERVHIQSNTIEKNGELGLILDGASGVLVGDQTDAPGRSPANEILDGVLLEGTFGSWLRGNRISNADAATGRAMGAPAVYVVGGNRNTIGGELESEGNVLVGAPVAADSEGGLGVLDEAANTVIENNQIGAEGGFLVGVVLRSEGAEVRSNVISGNHTVGLSLEAGATVVGNRIGTDRGGTSAIPNAGAGVEVTSGTLLLGGEKAGGACEGPCNVISGNGGPGVVVGREASARIEGNVIGTSANGATALGNEHGVVLLADGVRVGGASDAASVGTCSGLCNLIAGNHGDGVRTFNQDDIATPNDPSGAATVGAVGAGGVQILGNVIGRATVGNGGHGVALGAGNGNVVGTTALSDGNVIEGNGASGVAVFLSTDDPLFGSRAGRINRIRGNRIVGNGTTAIDLAPGSRLADADGWSTLDTEDDDDGGNGLLNWPYLVESRQQAGTSSELLVLWTGEPGTYTVDVYASAEGCVSGGTAASFLTSRSVEFPADEVSTAVIADLFTAGGAFTAIVTDGDGNTGELSNCRSLGKYGREIVGSVDAEARTLLNGVFATLRRGGSRMASRVAGSARAGDPGATLLAVRLPEAEPAPFEDATATSASGAPVRPRSTAGPAWDLVTLDGLPGDSYDLCFEASTLGDEGGQAVVLVSGPGTNGWWRPVDTRAESTDGVDYLCADGLPGTASYALGLGEAPPPSGFPVATLAATSAAVVEGEDIELTVSLGAPAPAGGVRVDVRTTADAAADLGGFSSQTVVIAEGTSLAPISIPVSTDEVAEPEEAVTFRLWGPVRATLGDPAVALVTIGASTESRLPTASFTAVQRAVSESVGSADLVVRLSDLPARAAALAVTLESGDPTDLGGFERVVVPIPSAPGAATDVVVTVAVDDDRQPEADETFVFRLSVVDDGGEPALAVGALSSTALIVDDDDAENVTVVVPPVDADGDGVEDGGPRLLTLPVSGVTAGELAATAGGPVWTLLGRALVEADAAAVLSAGQPVVADVAPEADLMFVGRPGGAVVSYASVGAGRRLVAVGNPTAAPVALSGLSVAGGALGDVALVFDRGAFRPISLAGLSDATVVPPFGALLLHVLGDETATVLLDLASAPGGEDVTAAPFVPLEDESVVALSVGSGVDAASRRISDGGRRDVFVARLGPATDDASRSGIDMASPFAAQVAADVDASRFAAFATAPPASGEPVVIPLHVEGDEPVLVLESAPSDLNGQPFAVELLDGGAATPLVPGDSLLLAGPMPPGRFALRLSVQPGVARGDSPDGAVWVGAVFPNPTSGHAEVEVALRTPMLLRVVVYDVLGRQVAVARHGDVGAGTTRIDVPGSLLAGTYLVRVEGAGFFEVRRLTVLR